jgi:hypothetical protein
MVKDNDHENAESLQNTSKGPMKIQKIICVNFTCEMYCKICILTY